MPEIDHQDTQAIFLLCSHLSLAEEAKPLEPGEWNQLARILAEQQLTPGVLLDYSAEDYREVLHLGEEEAERLVRLMERSGSLLFELSRYEEMGIQVVSRADPEYPEKLKRKLRQAAPPLFYCAGDLALLRHPVLGFVGSRSLDAGDLTFTQHAVRQAVAQGYGVVSGGAKGVDSAAAFTAMEAGSFAIQYLSDSMMKKLRDAALLRTIREGRALLLSAVNPTAGFQVGAAMARNKYIYAQSEGTVVVRSDLRRGGTWAGATENLRHNWCPTLCRDCDFPGNRELISMGAIPIDETWDGTILEQEETAPGKPGMNYEQISMFG